MHTKNKHTCSLLVEKLSLKPHPEGGFFAEIHRSEHQVTPRSLRYNGEQRHAGTLIYYLLQEDNYSAWHRLHSDETWHFHKGCPIYLHTVDPEYNFRTIVLGDPLETAEATFHAVTKAGHWFAAELTDKSSFGLVSCAVYPGFEFKDFELANEVAIKSLIARCPKHEELIKKLIHPSYHPKKIG
jgi:predicted cupin superfamily sugar epimerase